MREQSHKYITTLNEEQQFVLHQLLSSGRIVNLQIRGERHSKKGLIEKKKVVIGRN